MSTHLFSSAKKLIQEMSEYNYKPNGVVKIDLAREMAPTQAYFDALKDQMELNIKLTSAVLYIDTGQEPKMWDINTPMPVKGDSQILAHIKL